MYARILRWSLRSQGLVLALALVLLVAGLDTARRLQVDVLPDLTRPTVSVQVEAAGRAPEEVEAEITQPLEAVLGGLPDITRLRSVSAPGLTILYAEFDWHSDPYRNRQLVAERLEAARGQLPDGLQPRIGPVTSLMSEVLLIALSDAEGRQASRFRPERAEHAGLEHEAASSDGNPAAPYDPDREHAMDLRDAADWTLRPALLAVPGVAQVTVLGGETRQYEIRPDLARLRQLGVTLAELVAATQGHARNLGAGYADAGGREIVLRSIGRPIDLDALRQVAVARRGTAIVRVGQIAEVAVGTRLKRGDAGVDGEPAVMLAIQKQPNVDTLRLTAALEARLDALAAALPPGIERVTVFRQADFIRHAIDNVRTALRDGAAIVALVLFAFLLSGRATLIALLAIPLSVVTAILALRLAGLGINTMTLGGLAIAVGELVDDAVVGIENVARRLRTEPVVHAGQRLRLIARATLEVRAGVLLATVLIVLAVLPLFALGGIEGRLFAPLVLAYVAAILASLIVAITVTPVLCALAFGRAPSRVPVEPRWLTALKRVYVAALARVLARSGGLAAFTALLLVAAVLLALARPRSFLPAFNESTLTVNLVAQPGVSLAVSNRLGRLAEQQLLTVPEVATVGRRTGRAELDEHAEGLHYSELDVVLRPDRRRPREAILADLRAALAALPAQVTIGQPIAHRLDHLLSGVRAPLVVKLRGADLAVLRDRAAEVQRLLAGIPTLADVQIEALAEVPQLRLRIDARAAAQYGIAPTRAQEALAALTVGQTLSQVVEGEQRHALTLWLPDAARRAETIGSVLIDGLAGTVPLAAIASLDPGVGPNQILREQQQRRLVVTAYPAPGRFDEGADAAQALLLHLPLPPGYTLQVEGEATARAAASQRLIALAALSLLLMLAVLVRRERSWRHSLIVLGNVPLAFIGGIGALAVADVPLSIASLIGFVSLAGIAARNGILKLSHFERLRRHDGLPFGRELVLRGSGERLVPVLMTALVALLALLPLLADASEPGHEILHPVALVIFGGLLSATLLDSFVTPALYLRFGAPRADRAH